MQTQPLQTGSAEPVEVRAERHLKPVPAIEEVARERRWIRYVALLTAFLLGLAVAGIWQQIRINDLDEQIAQQSEQIAQLQTTNAGLEDELATQQDQIQQLQGDLAGVTQFRDQLALRIERLRARIAFLGPELAAANARVAGLAPLVGPALQNGVHTGYVIAVGATQEPPRIVMDKVIIDEQGVQNLRPTWRTLPVDPDMVFTYVNGQGETLVTGLTRFGNLWSNPASWAVELTEAPYEITLADGLVTDVTMIT